MRPEIILAALALIGLPLGAVAYLALGEAGLRRLPERRRASARAWLWISPGLILLAVFLVFPTLHTFALSFLDARSASPVGLANYEFVVTDPLMRGALRNSLIWVVCFPLATVTLGLAVAAFMDRVRYEPAIRAIVFMPMAISFVAAGVIWRLVYDFRPPPLPQTGLANAALMLVVPGFEPQAWLVNQPPLNTGALVVAAAWVWTGFCAVVLSAALKGIPHELLEAARVDGASEWQVFRHVILPALGPMLGVVGVTMVIFALKAFDIVYVMTSGNYDTDVIASKMYREMFNARDFGRASAIAVVLLAAVGPVAWLNLRHVQRERADRR